ncbi:ParA family protein [Hymenobacter sp. YC55]|uniref:ParA family protein n=1 Tax=Hymenobacter sp. YC55 TaxID=3034019 RepID=UPI0023F7036D|nr:ParA family protein [Hymenobacter sp. YC55]MDF7815845.1 ParA family protein [Hymenobacter sp. YC55]
MQTIVFSNHKGGTGKTTSCLNVAYALTQLGKSVLLVDCDSQCNLSQSFAYRAPENKTIGTVLLGQASLSDVVEEVGEGLYLVPSASDLAEVEERISKKPGAEFALKEVLDEVEEIDFCLIDTPGGLGKLTYAALTAADAVFIPAQPEYYGIEGLVGLLEVCQHVQKRLNKKLKVGGLFFTQYNRSDRRRAQRDMVNLLESHAVFGPLVMRTTVRPNVSLVEAQIEKENIYNWAPQSAGAQDYEALTTEILSRL